MCSFYINFNVPKEEVVLIDLFQIRTIKVISEDNNVYYQRKWKSILLGRNGSKIGLEVTFVDEQPKANLFLYEYKDGMQDLIHIKGRAEHWKGIIDNCVEELSPAV